jgi:hypothetical protein
MKYVDQLDAVGRAAMEIGVEAGMQKISDMFLAALALEGYGEDRLVRLAARVSELDSEFDGAYGCGPEADGLQERLDAILRKACGSHFVPFRERNPHIREFNYKVSPRRKKK